MKINHVHPVKLNVLLKALLLSLGFTSGLGMSHVAVAQSQSNDALSERTSRAMQSAQQLLNRNQQGQTVSNGLAAPDELTRQQLEQRSQNALDAAAQSRRYGLPDFAMPANTTLPKSTEGGDSGKAQLQQSQKGGKGQSSFFEPEAMAKRFAQASAQAPEKQLTSAPLIFVSLSMPPASLERLAQDAAKIGAPLVIRGMVQGSLRKTTQALAPYSRYGAEIIIHPQAFAQYGITVVPSFVFDPPKAETSPAQTEPSVCFPETHTCAGALPRIEGDIRLAFALQKMRQVTPEQSVSYAQLNTWINKLEGRGNR